MTLRTIEMFLATVDPQKATVVSFPEFVAIFGGSLRSKNSRAQPKSQRDFFLDWILKNRGDLKDLLLLPEHYEDWKDFNTYSDLLLFEKDLGYLTSAVLVFLEGAGAIAELGAFSQIESLSERLVIVVADDLYPKKSFISAGPIRSVVETKKYPHSLCVLPAGKPAELVKHIAIIIETLDRKRALRGGTKSFDKTDPQHEILLILDLVNLFLAPTITELQLLASNFGKDLKRERLHQILFLLKKTSLISSTTYGDVEYYRPHRFQRNYLDYSSKPATPNFNRERTKAITLEELQNDKFRKHTHGLGEKAES